MAPRNAIIGTGVAVAGFAGLAAAAATLGAPESTTPLRPAANTVETQTEVRTVEDRATRLKVHKRHDGRTEIRAAKAKAAPAAQATASPAPAAVQSDDGPAHDAGDDRGRGVEAGDDRGRGIEPGDDRGREAEPGDDRGDHAEPGDDRGGEAEAGDDRGGNSGHGGGHSQDD